MDETHHLLQYSPSSSSSKRPHHVHMHGHNFPGRHRISRRHELVESAAAQWFAYIATLPEIKVQAGVHVPDCNCGVPCCLVLDEGSAPDHPCKLWVCLMYTCTFYEVFEPHTVPKEISAKIHVIDHRAENSNITAIAGCWDLNDTIGELVIDEKYTVDRFVSLWYVLGWWGDSFSSKFLHKLDARHQEAVAKGNPCKVIYPKGSAGLKPNEEYDGFISYRWNSGRSNLTMSFLSVFGLPWVTFTMFIVYPILAVILLFGLTKPIGMFDEDRFNPPNTYQDAYWLTTGKNYFLGHCDMDGGSVVCNLFWFQLIGVFLLIPILLFSAQFVHSRSKYFLDRQVICQTDSEVTTFGIVRLPLYLKNSKTLYVFFDDKYVTRTWCMAELCFYLALRKNPDVRFISIPHHKAGVALTLLFLMIYIGYGIIQYLFFVLGTGLKWETINGVKRLLGYPRMQLTQHISAFIIQLLAECCMIYFGRQFFKSLRALKAAEDRFDVRKCECGNQEDLPFLLSSIDHFFGSVSTEDDSGIDSFNKFLRRSLRAYASFHGLSSCLIVSYVPALIVGSALSNRGWSNNWFFMLDNVAGNITEDNHIKRTTFWIVLNMVWAALVYGPFVLYTYSALLKLLWFLEQRFRWLPWYILYPCFVVFDIFVPVRDWVFDSLILELARAVCETHGIWYVYTSPFQYVPLLFSTEIPWFEADKPLAGNLLSLAIPIWGRVFVWIWLVFVSLFTYMVYEPISWQRYRQAGWSWLRQKFSK